MMLQARCPVCVELIGVDEQALCCGCSQALHPGCLRTALMVDSRCALCRADLAVSGYTIGGVVAYPESRRFLGDALQLLGIMAALRELQSFTSIAARSANSIDATIRLMPGMLNDAGLALRV